MQSLDSAGGRRLAKNGFLRRRYERGRNSIWEVGASFEPSKPAPSITSVNGSLMSLFFAGFKRHSERVHLPAEELPCNITCQRINLAGVLFLPFGPGLIDHAS